ncbi:MAG: rhomboid family intramembrane serine protease [Chitinophagales bacterium]|nr:rhomboid family intramembrane serine protease [Chitinophagales bacterium]
MTITYGIIIVTVITSLMAFNNRATMSKLIFNPYVIHTNKDYSRFISSGFIHADFMHLFFNMYALYLFGGIVEQSFKSQYIFGNKGNLMYIILYISGLIMSSVYSYFKHKNNPAYNALGASGAVSAIVFCSIILYPTNKLMIFPIPFFMPAYILGVGYLLYSFFMGRRANDNIGHDAHFYGAVWGILFIVLLWKPALGNFIAQLGF